MALRMTAKRRRLLRKLLRSGDLPVELHTEYLLLEQHQLVERYIDPTRVLSERWRLTTPGERVARFFLDWR